MCQWYSEVYNVIESYGNPFILFLYSRPHLPGCPSGLTCCRTETFAFSIHAHYFDHLQFAWNGPQEVPPRGSLVFPWSRPLLYHRITSSTQFWTEAGIWVAKHTSACASQDMFGWGWSSSSQSPESWTVLIKWRVGGDNKYYNNMIINQRLKPGREMIWWKVGIWRRQLRGWGAKEQRDSVRNRHGVRSGGRGDEHRGQWTDLLAFISARLLRSHRRRTWRGSTFHSNVSIMHCVCVMMRNMNYADCLKVWPRKKWFHGGLGKCHSI